MRPLLSYCTETDRPRLDVRLGDVSMESRFALLLATRLVSWLPAVSLKVDMRKPVDSDGVSCLGFFFFSRMDSRKLWGFLLRKDEVSVSAEAIDRLLECLLLLQVSRLSFSRSLRAFRWPTSSRSGLAHTTSNMMQ